MIYSDKAARYRERTAALLGEEAMRRLKDSFVAVVGLGGVGGSCAEALARSGVGRLLLIDGDIVDETNLNRQAAAAESTLGMKKTEALSLRLRDVSQAELMLVSEFVNADNAEGLIPPEVDFVVDAVDDMEAKIALARLIVSRETLFVACMGAGRRLDPSGFRVMDVMKTTNCPLARRYRRELRAAGIAHVPVVASDETPIDTGGQLGSFAPAVNAAGLVAAAFVIRTLCGR